MAFIDSRKRKLTEDGSNAITKLHKRHRSDHTPSLAIDDQAQLRNGEINEAIDNASVTIAPPVKEVANQQQDLDKIARFSADPAPAVRPAKTRPSEKTAQKQKVSSAKISSSDEGDNSITDLAAAAPSTASYVATYTASISPSEEAFDAEDESEEDDYDDQEGEEEVQPENSDRETQARPSEKKARHEATSPASDPESNTSSESSTEWSSDAALESDDESHPENNNHNNNKKKEVTKADDPTAFASSISAILNSNLTRTQRANPILARSADAKEAESALRDRKLEKKARAEMKREKLNDKGGWEPDVMMMGSKDDIKVGESIGDDGEVGAHAAYQRRERELRKMAQRGVVKMFNAFAHVREKAVEAQGVGGSRAKKEEKATEMTKEGWLEYVGQGGKGQLEKRGKSDKS